MADWTLRQRCSPCPGRQGRRVRQRRPLAAGQIRPDQLLRFSLSMEDVLAAARKATAITGPASSRPRTSTSSSRPKANRSTRLRSRARCDQRQRLERAAQAMSPTLSMRPSRRSAAPPSWASRASCCSCPGSSAPTRVAVTQGSRARWRTCGRRSRRKARDARATCSGPPTSSTSRLATCSALLLGAVLVVVVLFLFLSTCARRPSRAVAFRCRCWPRSSCSTPSASSLNIMTLGGLAIAIGEVVDDAIIDAENIFRRLRENRLCAKPRAHRPGDRHASLEVRSSVVYATFIVILVFLPLLMLPGRRRALLRPARPRLHLRHPRVARRGADRHAGAVHAAVPEERERRRRSCSGGSAGHALAARPLRAV